MAEEEEGEFAGTVKLLRRLMIQVAEGIINVAAGASPDIVVDTIPDLFHAFYIFSAFCIDNPAGITTIDVICEGPGFIPSGGTSGDLAGIGVTLFKRRKSGANAAVQQEVRLIFSNITSINANIAYKVYRIAGLL